MFTLGNGTRMGSTEDSERKRRHLNNSSVSPPLKKQPMGPSSEEKKVDASVLQYQNQKLAQQLDVQKSEIHALEDRFNQLKKKQTSFDDTLILVNKCWTELENDLELLTIRANGTNAEVRSLEFAVPNNDKVNVSVPPEETFLQRLLETGATENSMTSNHSSVESALSARKSSTVKTIKHIVQAIDVQRAKNEDLAASLRGQLSADGAGQLLQQVDQDLRNEVHSLRSAMDILHLKHKEIAAHLLTLQDNHAKDQAEITRLTGELEETMSELETSRRKLASLRSQKDGPLGPPTPGNMSTTKEIEKGCQRSSREIRELEAALEESKNLASQRLSELQEAQRTKLNMFQQIQRLQDSLADEQRILASRPYGLLGEQVQYLKSEVERCQALVDQLQSVRDHALQREKETAMKAEAGEIAKRVASIAEARIVDLETQLQQCMTDKDDLQIKLEEASELSGRKDTVAELKVMITTLHKEMSMMQTQLYKYKDAAREVCALRANIHSCASVLERKTAECQALSDQVASQVVELNNLKDEVRKFKESEQELKLILDMYGMESTDPRDVMELQQAECRARAQVERLKEALDEHSLELRVKAANEAEAACQQRLAAAEAEIAELRQRLDASDRAILELSETLKAKNEEAEAFLSEIETIGQAYEDMQTQNQRLLQQISERDDYNTKLVSESLKAKQLQTSLIAEKQLMASRMQHANAAAELRQQRILKLEEQARSYLDQLAKAADESRQYSSALENAKRKAAEAEREAASTKSALAAAEKELDDRAGKIAEAHSELEKERFEKRRVQEELTALNSKFARLQNYNEGGTMIERLQEEIKEYKTILKCSVCHDRPKEVVITKCYHLFCSPCIQRNLELRHRKCPGCGVPFGQNDVRNVYI